MRQILRRLSRQAPLKWPKATTLCTSTRHIAEFLAPLHQGRAAANNWFLSSVASLLEYPNSIHALFLDKDVVRSDDNRVRHPPREIAAGFGALRVLQPS